MTRVLLATAPGVPLLGPSGASAHVRGVAGALRPNVIVCGRVVDRRGAAGAVEGRVIEAGVPGWPSWLSSWREYTEVWTARRAARIVVPLGPSLVWERHALYSDAGWKAHAATGCRWILEVNAPLADERARFETLPHPRWARSWEREVLRAAPEIVAVSRWLCGWLESLGCRNVRHLPNGVVPRVGDRAGARAALGVGDALVVGFVGSMKPWHGADRLPAILDRLPGAVGLLVGDGPVVPEHPRLLRAGQADEARVADLVAAMDVALAPYGADSPPWFCPLKVLAYRAQGTPTVAADVGDCRELVGDGGTVLPPGASPDDWADAVRTWAGRRVTPWVRSWERVVAEGLGGPDGYGTNTSTVSTSPTPHSHAGSLTNHG